MDETGQPGNEPARVYANGTGNGARPAHPTGWQLAAGTGSRLEPNVPCPESNGSRLDMTRPVNGRRPAEASWSSAGAALEPAGNPVGSPWRAPVTVVPRNRDEISSRYADFLAPVSPALPSTTPASAPPYPYEGDLDPVADGDHENWSGQWIPADRGMPPAGPPSPPVAVPYESDNLQPPGALSDPTLDDLPALAQMTAASQAAARQAAAAAPTSAPPQAQHAAAEAPPRMDPSLTQFGAHAAPVMPPPYLPHPQQYHQPQPHHEPYHEPQPQSPPEPVAPPVSVAQGAQAAQAAAQAVRAAQMQAAADDRAAVEAAYAAAVDAREELPEQVQPRMAPVTLGGGGTLPQRIPAAPDVPDVPDEGPIEGDFVEQDPAPPLASPELARIATHLRDEDLEAGAPQRPDGFDMEAVLAAVREVPGVRDAQLRPNANGVHTLRLDLAEGADGGRVSREVARLLKQRMGLAAEPRRTTGGVGTIPPAVGTVAAPMNPSQPRDSMPVAGAPPTPRLPIPPGAAEQLGGPAAANVAGQVRGADERAREALRRHPVSTLRGRNPLDSRGQYAPGEHGQAEPQPRQAAKPGEGTRVVLDQVQVSTLGLDATVEVRLISSTGPAIGVASGPAVDGYVLRLAAVAAAAAIDQLLSTVDSWDQPGRCFVEHASVVPMGSCEVAVVVVLLVCGGWVEQLSGAALVNGDPRQAVVRATLAAVNRRLDGLLS